MLDYTVLSNQTSHFIKQTVKFDVSESIKQVLEILDDNLNHKNVKATVTYKGFSQGTVVLTDKNRFQQVLLNVLSNSLKYTNRSSKRINGLFEIVVQLVEHKYLKVYVTDSSIRIDQKEEQ